MTCHDFAAVMANRARTDAELAAVVRHMADCRECMERMLTAAEVAVRMLPVDRIAAAHQRAMASVVRMADDPEIVAMLTQE